MIMICPTFTFLPLFNLIIVGIDEPVSVFFFFSFTGVCTLYLVSNQINWK